MRAERSAPARAHRVRVLSSFALAALAAAAPARASEGLTAKLSIQYQRVEFDDFRYGPDSLERFTTSRSLWLQTYEVNHSARFGNRLRVLSQFRLTDLEYVDRPEGSRQPYGSLRLVHPFFGVTGTHRPTTTTGVFSARGFAPAAAESSGAAGFTTRDRETALLGYLAVPRAPRIDVAWIRRSRDASEFSFGGIGTTRNARMNYATGPFRMNAGYQDILRQSSDRSPILTDQRSLNGGAGLRLSPWRSTSLDFSYNAYDTRRGLESARDSRSLSQLAAFTGTVVQSPKTTWNAGYNYRRSNIRASADTAYDDHDASLTWRHQPVRTVELTGSGGLRTERVFARADLVRYVSGVASVRGTPRKGLQGIASLSHASNWSRERSVYSIETARVGSAFDLRRGLRARLDAQVSANGDSAARGNGTVSNVSGSVEMTPWRSVTAELSMQRYRTGPGLFVARSVSNSEGVRLQWQPLAALQLMGYLSRAGALPNNDPRLTTQQVSARWSPAQRLQLTGSYMKSEQARTSADAQQLSGREIVSVELVSALSATARVSAAYSAADPGSERSSRQYDVTFTKSFGP